MSALGKRRPDPGSTRYNTVTGELEVMVPGRGWMPFSPTSAVTPSPSISAYVDTSTTTTNKPSLPYVIETVNSLMQDMDNEQLDDLIDAALEELRVRGKGKFPE